MKHKKNHKKSKHKTQQRNFYKNINLWFRLIDEWMYQNISDSIPADKSAIIKFMFLEKVLKYKFTELNNLFELNWSKEEYIKLSRKFTNLVNEIEEDLITRTDLNDMFEEDDRYHEMDWYQANSYDNLFGKKYIGYLRREDNDSKFGSYPLHDDYSEDSTPDKFTNLDY